MRGRKPKKIAVRTASSMDKLALGRWNTAEYYSPTDDKAEFCLFNKGKGLN